MKVTGSPLGDDCGVGKCGEAMMADILDELQ